MPWQTAPVIKISPDALTAKVLCRRHNAALSPLDEEAFRVYDVVRRMRDHATKRSLSGRSIAAIVSGEALELWAMKTIAGVCASGMDFTFGDHRLKDFDLPLAEIAASLTSLRPQAIVSLEIPATREAHEEKLGRSAVTILWEVDTDVPRIDAMIVRMHGLGFKFHLKPSGTAADGDSLVRPHIFDLIGPKRHGRFYFSWPNVRPGRYGFVRMSEARGGEG